MKTASRILLLVSGIVSIVAVVLYFVFGGIFVYASSESGKQMLVDAVNEGWLKVEGASAADTVKAAQIVALVFGVIFLIEGALCIATAVISFIARSNPTKGKLIATIVFSALSLTTVGLVGGIFGLISLSKKRE